MQILSRNRNCVYLFLLVLFIHNLMTEEIRSNEKSGKFFNIVAIPTNDGRSKRLTHHTDSQNTSDTMFQDKYDK